MKMAGVLMFQHHGDAENHDVPDVSMAVFGMRRDVEAGHACLPGGMDWPQVEPDEQHVLRVMDSIIFDRGHSTPVVDRRAGHRRGRRVETATTQGQRISEPRAQEPNYQMVSPLAETSWMTTRMAARYLSCCVRTLYRHVQAGTIKSAGMGRHLRFRRQDLDTFLTASQSADRSTQDLDGFINHQMGKAGH